VMWKLVTSEKPRCEKKTLQILNESKETL